MNRKWSKDDEEKLLNYKNEEKTNEEIIELFDGKYSIQQIYSKTQTLNIGVKNYWSEEELKVLENANNNFSIEEVIKLLPNRTKYSIRAKIKDLGLKLKQTQNRWTKKEIDILLNCSNLKINEVKKLLPNRSTDNIRQKARELNISILLDYVWEIEEDNILIKNANGKMTITEVSKLLPNRTRKAVQGRIIKLKLSYSDPNKKGISKNKDYSAKSSIKSRYKTKFGIELDFSLGIYTYDCIQWWNWLYYGTPNGKKLKSLPIEIYNDNNNLFKIIKYVFIEVLNYKTKDDFLNLKIDILKKYKIDFKHQIKSITLCDLLNHLFPNYNFKPFELNNVPLGYWKNINNCDEYMKYVIEELIGLDNFTNFKNEIPSIFNYRTVRKLGYGILAYCINTYKHYDSFYQWLNKLYPEWNLTPEDFSENHGFDGIRLNSSEEVSVYNLMKKDLSLDVKAIGLGKTFKFYDSNTKNNYVPDFLINYKNRKIIVEYFGLYREKYGKSEILKNYYFKTHDKIKYFSNIDDYDFIYILHDEIKDLELLKNKLINSLRGGEIIEQYAV
jgi:hypothetical protein